MRLQESRRTQTEVVALVNARYGMLAGDVSVRCDREGELVAKVEKLKGSLQQVIAIGPSTHNMQKQIQLCRGWPHIHPGILSTPQSILR